MVSIKSGLFGLTALAFIGASAIVGCSADGGSGDFLGSTTESKDPTEPTTGNRLPSSSAPLPDSEDDDDEPAEPKTKKDGGSKSKADAGVDAGPPAPEAGDACAQESEVFKRTCGFCGTQTALCLEGTVTEYGACKNEVEDGCAPGSTETIACGNCGTQARTCNNFCRWVGSVCTGQPKNSCTPGAVELDDVGCQADEYRQKTCTDQCQWGYAGSQCEAPPTFVIVPPTVGSVNSTIVTLSNATANPLPSGKCPLTSSWPSSLTKRTPSAYIEVRNPNPKAITVSIYNSQSGSSGPIIDTVMTYYEGSEIPASDIERRACKGNVGDLGDANLTGSNKFASLSGTNAVTIPANGAVQVYTGSWYAFDPTNPDQSTGVVKLNVRTESIAP